MRTQNVFDKAGLKGLKLLIDVIEGKTTHKDAADILGCSPSNVSSIVNRMDLDELDTKKMINNVPVSTYAKNLAEENLQLKVKQLHDGKWDIDPYQVLVHNIIRIDRYIMSGQYDMDREIAMMIEQSKITEKLAKIRPDQDDSIDINEMFEKSDQVINYIPVLAKTLKDQGIDFDVKRHFLDYIKGKTITPSDYQIEDV